MLVELLVRRGAGLRSDHLAPARVERGGRSLARGRVRVRVGGKGRMRGR